MISGPGKFLQQWKPHCDGNKTLIPPSKQATLSWERETISVKILKKKLKALLLIEIDFFLKKIYEYVE